MLQKETHFRCKDTHRLKVKGWIKISYANGNQKKTGVAILILDNVDFKTKTVIRGKGGCHIMLKGSTNNKL